MKRKKLISLAMVFLSLLLVIGCNPETDNPPEEAKKGRVILSLKNDIEDSSPATPNARGIESNSITISEYRITGNSFSGETIKKSVPANSSTVELELSVDSWTIKVEAINDKGDERKVIGEGNATLTVTEGQENSATISIKELSGTGNLTINIECSSDIEMTAIIKGKDGKIESEKMEKKDSIYTATFTLDNGFYSVFLKVKVDDKEEEILVETVRIVKDDEFTLTGEYDLIQGVINIKNEIIKTPTIVLDIEQDTVAANGTLKAIGEVTNIESPEYSWYLDGKKIEDQNTLSLEYPLNNLITGEHRLVLFASNGEIVWSSDPVIFTVSESITIEDFEITTETDYTYGDTLNASLSVDFDDYHTITWYLDDELIEKNEKLEFSVGEHTLKARVEREGVAKENNVKINIKAKVTLTIDDAYVGKYIKGFVSVLPEGTTLANPKLNISNEDLDISSINNDGAFEVDLSSSSLIAGTYEAYISADNATNSEKTYATIQELPSYRIEGKENASIGELVTFEITPDLFIESVVWYLNDNEQMGEMGKTFTWDTSNAYTGQHTISATVNGVKTENFIFILEENKLDSIIAALPTGAEEDETLIRVQTSTSYMKFTFKDVNLSYENVDFTLNTNNGFMEMESRYIGDKQTVSLSGNASVTVNGNTNNYDIGSITFELSNYGEIIGEPLCQDIKKDGEDITNDTTELNTLLNYILALFNTDGMVNGMNYLEMNATENVNIEYKNFVSNNYTINGTSISNAASDNPMGYNYSYDVKEDLSFSSGDKILIEVKYDTGLNDDRTPIYSNIQWTKLMLNGESFDIDDLSDFSKQNLKHHVGIYDYSNSSN